MKILVTNSKTAAPVTNAYFSANWAPLGSNEYRVDVGPNQLFWCDADGYQQEYADSDDYTSMVISLDEAIWPNR
jgi:hypothetical protein